MHGVPRLQRPEWRHVAVTMMPPRFLWILILALALLGASDWLWSRAALRAPPASVMLLDRNGDFLAQAGGGGGAEFGYWPVETVPPRVAAAIVAIEDHRFAVHPGIDPLAAGRAAWRRLSGGGRSGASTIAMQVARMQDPGPRTFGRKLVEAATAMVLTLRHGRAEVLRQYLRLVPFGNGSHGIAHAARWYLDKPVSDLSWAEIAFLCAIPQSPARYNPFHPEGRERAVRRGRRILAALAREGLLGPEELGLAESQIGQLDIPDRGRRPLAAMHAILRLEHLVAERPPGGEPVVVSSLDLAVQKQVAELAAAHLREWRGRGAEQVAAVVLDRRSREVLAWVGSDDYFSPAAGAIDFTGTRRSPGSALKPFLYALALERGRITANTVLADLPDAQFGIENADHDWLGPLLPRQALANSRNVPAAVVLRETGLEDSYRFLYTLGLHENEAPPRHFGLVLAVGALPTTLERLVRAYGALADDGRLTDPVWYRGQPVGPRQQVLSVAAARQITLFLSDPLARLPSFPRLGMSEASFPLAIKTGTSQGYRDAWAVAWSPDYLVGVWTGRAKGTTMRAVTGAGSSAQLAQGVLTLLHHTRGGEMSDIGFPTPEGWAPVSLCTETGLRAAGRCAHTLVEWFPRGQVPQEDDAFQLVRVDLRNGLLAGPWTPPQFAAERTFATLAPEHAGWGLTHDLPPPPSDLSPLDRPDTAARRPPGTTTTTTAGPPAGPPRLAVSQPRNGMRLVRNPETPPELDLMTLRAITGPGIERIEWWVDDRPWRSAGPHDPVQWPLSPGAHRFQVRSADGGQASAVTTISVE